MMRVSLLTMHSCPLAQAGERDTGGMNVYVLALARELEAREFCVDIFTRYHTPRDPEVVRVGPHTRVIHVPSGKPDETKENLFASVAEFAAGVEAFREGEGLSYDLVHSHYWLSGQAGVSLANKWAVPHLTSFHTLAEVKGEAFLSNREVPQRAPMEARVISEVDRIIAWTEHEADALARLYGAPRDRIDVVPIGVDLSLFQPRDRVKARQRLGVAPEDEVVLFIGRLDPIKGADLLLEAASQLRGRPRLRVFVVGGDQKPGERRRLEQYGRALGLDGRVSFHGPAPHEELPWYYSAADVQVVPSYYESFSMVTAEALACGTPVVAADVDGPASLVQDGVSGYLVPPGNAEALAERIAHVLGDRALRGRMADRAPATVAHLGWPAVADRVVGLYAAVVNGAADLTACVE